MFAVYFAMAGYIVYLQAYGEGALTVDDPRTGVYLFLSGTITTIPLVCFAAAVRRLRMTTLGFLQYLAPTIQFVLATAYFGEPFSREQLFGFLLVNRVAAPRAFLP